MTRSQACRILGVSIAADMQEIKKSYRQLMHKVHPDTDAFHKTEYDYSAQEINEAYAFLCKFGVGHSGHASHTSASRASTRSASRTSTSGNFTRSTSRASAFDSSGPASSHASSDTSKKKRWNAPVNPHAYTERNIYHYVEDYDCSIIGNFILDTGKFIWKPEEDFPLFLKSIFECSKKILEQTEQTGDGRPSLSRRGEVQAELTYLLTQQFIDASETLKLLIKPSVGKDADIYRIPSMLELSLSAPKLTAGATLYPTSITRHRLFLKSAAGQNVGYLSFHDDRLYYIVIPLLEQRRAQVKICVSEKQDSKKARNSSRYRHLDFWLKVPHTATGTFPENISLQIKNLLDDYMH